MRACRPTGGHGDSARTSRRSRRRSMGRSAARQFAEAGLSAQQVRTLVERGDLARAGRGVLVVAGSPDTWERRLWVGLLVLGPSALVSHEAAAALHRFDRCRPGAIEFLVPFAGSAAVLELVGPLVADPSAVRSGPGSRDPVHVGDPYVARSRSGRHRPGAVGGGDRTRRSDAERPRPSCSNAVLTSSSRVTATASMLARVLPDSGGHSLLERRFLTLVRRAGLPRPRTQVVHRAGTRTIARVDSLVVGGQPRGRGFRADRPRHRSRAGAAGHPSGRAGGAGAAGEGAVVRPGRPSRDGIGAPVATLARDTDVVLFSVRVERSNANSEQHLEACGRYSGAATGGRWGWSGRRRARRRARRGGWGASRTAPAGHRR